MAKPITVFPIASKVRIGKNIEATIVGIGIYAGNYVQYKCVWYEGSTRVSTWVEQKEVKVDAKKKAIQIGFERG